MEVVAEEVVDERVVAVFDEVMGVMSEDGVAVWLSAGEKDGVVILGESATASVVDFAPVQTALSAAAPSRATSTLASLESICAIPVVANFPVTENPIHAASPKPTVVI